jgi:hypothetical protein
LQDHASDQIANVSDRLRDVFGGQRPRLSSERYTFPADESL